MTAGRRCALPGCYVVIEPPTDGRPQRKYCTAAHRAIARQQRREGTQRSASAPPLPLPEPPGAHPPRRGLPLPPLAVQLEANPVRRPHGPGRRTRTLAMLGSAGLLVTGTTLSLTDDTAPVTGGGAASPWQAQDPEAEQNWASDARVSLAGIDRQLADVAAAERSWYALPAEARAGELPAGVRDLARRKALLEQQRDALAERLTWYDGYAQARRALAADERAVAELDRSLSAAPAPGQASPAEADEVRRLREERAARDQVLAAQRQEVERLREDVREVMAAPLPGGDRATRAITSTVRDLVRRTPGGVPVESSTPAVPDPLDHAHRAPDVLAAPPSTDPSLTGPSLTGPSAPQLPPAPSDVRPGPDVLAAPPAGGGLLDRIGGGTPQPGAGQVPGPAIGGPGIGGPGIGPAPAGGRPGVAGALPAPGQLPDVGGAPGELLPGAEAPVFDRAVSRVAYNQASPPPPSPLLRHSGSAGGINLPTGSAPSSVPHMAAARAQPPSSLAGLRSSGGPRDYDPVTRARTRLAADAADSMISSLPVDDNAKNLARFAAANEIRRQARAEANRYRATGGRDDPQRIGETVRVVVGLRAGAEIGKALHRGVKVDHRTATALLAAGAFKAAKPADQQRFSRLVSNYAKQRMITSALSGRYKPSRTVDSAVRDHFRASANTALKPAEHKARADITRRVVAKLFRR